MNYLDVLIGALSGIGLASFYFMAFKKRDWQDIAVNKFIKNREHDGIKYLNIGKDIDAKIKEMSDVKLDAIVNGKLQ